MESIDLLITIDHHVVQPLQVMLLSLSINDDRYAYHIHLIHADLDQIDQDRLIDQCHTMGMTIDFYTVDGSLFKHAPKGLDYPQAMYYRLLSPLILPKTIKRVIYLDPDILIINPIHELATVDLQGNLFAAASHTQLTQLANNVNQLRLNTDKPYYNSGVLVIDLENGRNQIDPNQIFDYVDTHYHELVLPDQDILNALYGDTIYPLDDLIYNYDARKYSSYLLTSDGQADMKWVLSNTKILHFCGKNKPWKRKTFTRFAMLYQHYCQIARNRYNVEI